MNFNPSLKTYVHLLDVKHKRLVSKAQVAGVSSCTQLHGLVLSPGAVLATTDMGWCLHHRLCVSMS